MSDYRNINVRSPFFTQKATTGSVVNCEVRLWKGDVVSDLPTNYTYLLSKEPTAGKSTFEVAELARDFLSHNTSLSSGFAWMQIVLKDTIVADDTFTFLVSEGYSLSTEGLQSTNDTPIYDFVGLPTATINGVANSSRIMVADGGTNSIPYFSNSDGAIYTVTDYFSDELITNGDFDTDSDWSILASDTIANGKLNISGQGTRISDTFSPIVGKNYFLTFDITDYISGDILVFDGAGGVNLLGVINENGSYSVNYVQTATSLNNLNFYVPTSFEGSLDNVSNIEVNPDAEVIPVTTTSTTMVKSKLVDDKDTTVDFDFNGETRKVFVDVLRCSKFDAVNLLYVNKFGFKTKFPFILKSTEKISVESDSFSRSTVDYGTLTLNTSSHSSRKRIKDTKQSFVLNSDWIAEYYVSQFEELMLSEYVWLEKGSLTLPVNITTSKLDKKTHINDKLINYSIEVETASNYINTIR